MSSVSGVQGPQNVVTMVVNQQQIQDIKNQLAKDKALLAKIEAMLAALTGSGAPAKDIHKVEAEIQGLKEKIADLQNELPQNDQNA